MAIPSPLTEALYAERQHYSPISKWSSDGLFQVFHKPLKQIRFLDANGKACIMKFKDKPR